MRIAYIVCTFIMEAGCLAGAVYLFVFYPDSTRAFVASLILFALLTLMSVGFTERLNQWRRDDKT